MYPKTIESLFNLMADWWPADLYLDIDNGNVVLDYRGGKEAEHWTTRFRIPVDRVDTRKFGLIRPLADGVGTLTQRFGMRPEVYKSYGLPGHEGIDWGAPHGSNVYASASGTVYRVHYDDSKHPYGTHVRIDHGNGYKTIYAHLSRVKVVVGENVIAGSSIGKVGSTGNSTGPHLHLTMKKTGATANKETNYPSDIIDPTKFFLENL